VLEARGRLCSRFRLFVALPFLSSGGLGVVIFFLATAYLLGREYFELAAMRTNPWPKPNGCARFAAARSLSPACSLQPSIDTDRQSRDAAVRHGVHVHMYSGDDRPTTDHDQR